MAQRDEKSVGPSSRTEDRRAGAGRRVRFEALVAVDGDTGESGFEAESVDLSREGMRLRTAYLPKVGDRLLCRFDGVGGEVSAEGEVTWCKEEARGGEFGLCFVSLDKATSDAIRSLCAPPVDAMEQDAPGYSAKGARVKLHIEGLGSPMKARVRTADEAEVQVGSNLEFLRIGRTLQFEDVDQAKKREAYVDHVKVDVDPDSGIPQLVVALRFDGVLGTVSPRAATPRPTVSAAKTLASPEREDVDARADERSAAAEQSDADADADLDEDRDEDFDEDLDAEADAEEDARFDAPTPTGEELEAREDAKLSSPPPRPSASAEPRPSAGAAAPKAGADAASDSDAKAAPTDEPEPELEGASGGASDEERSEAARVSATDADEESPHAFRAAGARAAQLTSEAMGRIAPAVSGFGVRARGAMGSMLELVRKKRAERAEAQRAARPRRTTAPPPSGALRSDGRRLVRDDGGELPEVIPPKRSTKKAALIGSAVGLAAVLSVYGASQMFGGADEAASAAPAPVATEATAATMTPTDIAAPIEPGGALTTDVPLFGPTPLSTTEEVLPPEPPPEPREPIAESEPDSDADAVAAAPSLDREWGQGTVENPTVLKIKLDGPIDGIKGDAGGSGFTVTVPDRKVLSSVTQLARKDKRVSSVKAVNRAEGAEITLKFTGDVPAFLAKAKGDRLEIAISGEQKKVASKSSKSKKKK